jgi:hypothetical protein
MVRRVRLFSALAGATAVGLISATNATAATNLGETFDPPDICATGTTYIVTGSVGNTYTVPFSGVVSRWSFHAGFVAPDSVRLKLGRVGPGTDLSAPDTNLSVVGESASEVPTPSSLNQYSTQISVQQGDFLGIYLGGDGGSTLCGDASSLGFPDHFNSSEVLAGTSATFDREDEGQIDVAAVLEPDADHDGFGDETQDQCPSNAGTQGSCAVTRAKNKCKKHKKKHHSAESAKKKKCKKKKHH